jgi:hypothetical protein
MKMEEVVEPRTSFFRFFEDYDEEDELDSEEEVGIFSLSLSLLCV